MNAIKTFLLKRDCSFDGSNKRKRIATCQRDQFFLTLYVEMQLTKPVHGYKKKQYILAQFSKPDAKDLVLVKLLVFKATVE